MKTLIGKMLVIEDRDRIGWPQMFEHPMIKYDAPLIISRFSKTQAIEEPVERAVELAHFYIEQNLVLNLTNKLHENV